MADNSNLYPSGGLMAVATDVLLSSDVNDEGEGAVAEPTDSASAKEAYGVFDAEARRPTLDRSTVCVAVIDDHELVSQLLVTALGDAGFEAFPAFAGSVEDIMAKLVDRDVDVVLLDYFLDPIGTGLDLIGPITSIGAHVIMLTAADDRLMLAECIDAGAVGFLHKGVSTEQLVLSIEAVVAGIGILSPADRADLILDFRQARDETAQLEAPFRRLTEREEQMLRAILDGRSANEIADDWDVSVATVRSHIRSVLVKLGAKSQLEAAAMAHRAGWPDFIHSD